MKRLTGSSSRTNSSERTLAELPAHNSPTLDSILGESSAIQQVKSLARQVASSDITVLITGESGTGKELVARSIHELSDRHAGPLMILNCGAIPEGIFESEIFGHEKGSFTSADQRRKGYFELADKGTLFLDEIGEMPLSVQVKILRVLETGSFIRVGGSSEVKVDVRIIGATNRDLENDVIQKKFRQDLYYRLKAISILLPPLRERIQDIPVLVNHFIREYSVRNKRPAPILNSEALDLMRRHYWKGNIRELKNFIESVSALSGDSVIGIDLIRTQLGDQNSGLNLPIVVKTPSESNDKDLIFRTLIDLRNEINVVKSMLSQLIKQERREVNYPFATAEEIIDYAADEVGKERNGEMEISDNNADQAGRTSLSLDQMEKEQIRKALHDYKGNRRLAAQVLGIGERTLYRKIKQYNLS